MGVQDAAYGKQGIVVWVNIWPLDIKECINEQQSPNYGTEAKLANTRVCNAFSKLTVPACVSGQMLTFICLI